MGDDDSDEGKDNKRLQIKGIIDNREQITTD